MSTPQTFAWPEPLAPTTRLPGPLSPAAEPRPGEAFTAGFAGLAIAEWFVVVDDLPIGPEVEATERADAMARGTLDLELR